MTGKIILDFNEEADILYLSFGEPKEAITKEIGNMGIRVDPKTNQIVGLTIIKFLKKFKEEHKPIQVAV